MGAVVAESRRIQAATPPSILHREHASPAERRRGWRRLDGPPLSLRQLRQLRVPRLSVEDLKATPPDKVCVVDVRPADDFQRGCWPGSVSAPVGCLLDDGGSVAAGPAGDAVRAARGHLMVVVGGRNTDAVKQTAEGLLAQGYPHVCTLHRGADALRDADALHVFSS